MSVVPAVRLPVRVVSRASRAVAGGAAGRASMDSPRRAGHAMVRVKECVWCVCLLEATVLRYFKHGICVTVKTKPGGQAQRRHAAGALCSFVGLRACRLDPRFPPPTFSFFHGRKMQYPINQYPIKVHTFQHCHAVLRTPPSGCVSYGGRNGCAAAWTASLFFASLPASSAAASA